jgi:hypothetical protein
MTATERVWLVDRTYSDKGMVSLVYATVEGDRYLRRQLSEGMLTRTDVTAGMDVDPERLEPVADDEERERFAAEATRIAERHDPDDAV